MNRKHFPNLNALRFYAALSVVVWHSNFRLDRLWTAPGWLSGYDAVTLFFVLSGFLITYLLLEEKRDTGRVHVRQFYARRILRIWPLYYLVVFIAYAVMGWSQVSQRDFILVLLLFPNIATRPIQLAHLWSIGAEEQFYIVYPALIRRFSVPKVCWWIIFTYWVALIICTLVPFTGPKFFGDIAIFLAWNRFDAMAFGGLFAWMVYKKHPRLQLFYRAFPVIAVTFAVTTLFASTDQGNSVYDTAFALLCAMLIVNIIRFPQFENRVTKALGNISYGIYIYHMPLLYILPVEWVESKIAVLLIIGVADLSYRYIETPILSLKQRFRAKERLTYTSPRQSSSTISV